MSGKTRPSQAGSSLDPPPKREVARFQEEEADEDGDDDDEGVNGDVEVDLMDYKKTEKEVFRKVKLAVTKHRKFLREGIVPFSEALQTLSAYKAQGYKPDPGTVVEHLDSNMEWKACVVSHTFIVVDEDDEDKTVTVMSTVAQDSSLKHGLNQGSDPDEVRPVRSAVLALFGETPLYWMQRQLLLAEKQMRYERFHCFDFEEIDWNKWASVRFFHWVGQTRDVTTGEWTTLKKSARDPLNGPFQKLFKKQESGAKDALFDLATEPFEVMFDINTDWFEDFQEEVSCYTYLSFLGHDWLTPLITFGIQLAIPVLLALTTLRSYKLRVDCDLEGPEDLWVGECVDASGTGSENFAFYCLRRTNEDAWMGRAMIICVMLFYSLQVVPAQIALFYSSVGDSEGTISKLFSLRKFVHDQDEDTLLTKIGFRVDLVMNSMYHCLLYTLNICMLYASDSVVDILLSSLAIEFVKDIDEGFTMTGWYDTDYRYLKAGAIEMVIRRYVDFHELDRLLNKPFSHEDGDVTDQSNNGNGGEDGKNGIFDAIPRKKASMRGARVSESFRARALAGVKDGLNADGEEVEDEEEDDACALEAFEYTVRPHHHFYGLVNWLRRTETTAKLKRVAGRAKAEAKAAGGDAGSESFNGCWQGCVASLAGLVRWLLPFSNEKPIFEKFGETYVDGPRREKEWERLLYAKDTAAKSFSGFEFLSVEKTKKRLSRVQDIASKEDWAQVLAEGSEAGNEDQEEKRILRKWNKRSTYAIPLTSPFVAGITSVLSFSDLPRHLRKAVDWSQPAASAGKIAFYVFFGGINWITVVVQLSFPLVFAALFFAVPMCY